MGEYPTCHVCGKFRVSAEGDICTVCYIAGLKTRIAELETQLKEAEELIEAVHEADALQYACDNRGYECEEDKGSSLCRACKGAEAYRAKYGEVE